MSASLTMAIGLWTQGSELTAKQLGVSLNTGKMGKRLSWLGTSRLTVALVVLFLVIAPFSANCCVSISCDNSGPERSSESPCHATMSAQQNAAFRWHKLPTICLDAFALPFATQPEELFRIHKAPREHQLELPAISASTFASSERSLVVSCRGGSSNSLQLRHSSFSTSPLKL
jgi:hypothetical protein